MALIKLGGGVAEIRGSIGGTTFSRNRYGAYARNRTIPVNPSTAPQQKVRSSISQARYAWFDVLSQAQRNAWDVYAANVPVQNRLGETTYLTGYNHFCRSYLALAYNDCDFISDGPTDFSLAEQDETLAITCSEAAQTIAVTFNDTAEWCDEDDAYLLIYASKPQNPTINFFAGPYLVAGKIAGSSTTAPVTGATVAAPHAFIAGQKLFVQARIVRADGRLSAPFRCSVTCVA